MQYLNNQKQLYQSLILGSQSLNTTIGLLKGRTLLFTPKLITFYCATGRANMSTSRDHIVSLSIVERYLKRFFELMRHPKSALGDHSLDKE